MAGPDNETSDELTTRIFRITMVMAALFIGSAFLFVI